MLFFARFWGGDILYTGERNGGLMGVSTGVICCRQTPVWHAVDEMHFGVTNRIVCDVFKRFSSSDEAIDLTFGAFWNNKTAIYNRHLIIPIYFMTSILYLHKNNYISITTYM